MTRAGVRARPGAFADPPRRKATSLIRQFDMYTPIISMTSNAQPRECDWVSSSFQVVSAISLRVTAI
jgi:hypothetical protein